MHFEELWELCEQVHKEDNSSFESIIDELLLKINVLKVIEQRTEISQEDKNQARSHLIGEILFILTNLSLKYNINVFEVLHKTLIQK